MFPWFSPYEPQPLFWDYRTRRAARAAQARWKERERDPRPAPQESLQEHIDRMLCGQPDGRHARVWGWKRPPGPVFIESSWVMTPADHTVKLNKILGL